MTGSKSLAVLLGTAALGLGACFTEYIISDSYTVGAVVLDAQTPTRAFELSVCIDGFESARLELTFDFSANTAIADEVAVRIDGDTLDLADDREVYLSYVDECTPVAFEFMLTHPELTGGREAYFSVGVHAYSGDEAIEHEGEMRFELVELD